MSPVFAARRRAEEFQKLVEDTSAGQGSDARFAELLEIVGSLRETAPVAARPEFVAELREQLLDEARTAARTGQGSEVADRLTVKRSPTARRRERRLAVAVGGLAIVGATTGMSVAAQSALPGDPLYPLKRAIENAQTGVQTDDDAKGKVLLENASDRLEEVDRLSRESDDAETIAETLQAFSDQASEASDLLLADYAETGHKDSVERLRNFTADSMGTIADLETLVPEGARASLIQAAQTLTQIDHAAVIACPSCGPDPVTQIPPFTNAAAGDLEELLGSVTTAPENTPDRPKKAQQPKTTDEEPPPAEDDPPIPLETELTDPPSGGNQQDDDNLVDNLTDSLTGKNKTDDGDGKTDPIEGTTDGLAELLGGLLGQ